MCITMMLPEHMQFCLTAPLPTSVWVGDELIVHTNAAFAALLGDKQHAAVLGRPAREGFGELWAVLEPLVARAPTVAEDVRLEIDGREVFATIALSRSSDGIVCTCVETTAHVLARRRAEAQAEVVRMLGHELRGPLAPAMMTLEVMRMTGQHEHADALARPLRQLSRLIDGLLEHLRIVRGTLELRRVRVDFAGIVARALEVAGPFGESVRVTEPADSPALLADVERLASAIAHLLVHAEHPALAASAAGGRLSIVVRDERWRIQDVARLAQESIEEPTGAFGVALAVARGIVALHGGTLVADGDTVTIELPIAAATPARSPELGRSGTRKRVLLVEDNDDTARSLRTALEMLGYEVAVAHDGPVALTVARAFRPDVALLDIGLPVMDGYELANRLRALDVATRELHVVAVTAYGTDTFKQRSRDAGFAEHLVKPVDLAKLERVVESLG